MFHSIFSNKKEKQTTKPLIIIDNREKNSLVASYLSEKANIKFEYLEIADYLIGNTAIERKTFNDFISSMINKRLFTQIQEIQKYPFFFLLIEGRRHIENKNLENAAKSLIISISKQIPIIFTDNEQETAQYLLLLANKKQKSSFSLRQSRTKQTIEEQKQFVLEGFPEIGPITSKKLLEKFKTIKNIINSPEQELKEILGKKYEKFKLVLD